MSTVREGSSDQVVVYGNGQVAGLAYFYLTHDSEYEVVAFTVEASFLKDPSFNGLPMVALEEVGSLYPPDQPRCSSPSAMAA